MGINTKATEFAGLPVMEYHPAVGIVLATMPRREFRSGAGGSSKFAAFTLERNRLTVQSGMVGTGGKTDAQEFSTAAAAQVEYGKRIAAIVKEGYAEAKQPATSTRDGIVAALAADPDDRVSRMALADYLEERGEEPPAVAYRVESPGYREVGHDTLAHLEAFLAEPAVGFVRALVVGACWAGDHSAGNADIVRMLIDARDRLTSLRALFLGDITYQECEISWLVQSDLTGLLTAFPELRHFRTRGGEGLVLEAFEHPRLESLAFEASNLPRGVVLAVGESKLPALEHLELWLGTEEYGANTTPADLAGILRGDGLPSLRYLGLRNSEIVNDLPDALAGAPILERLRVLDLSLGNLDDTGARSLLAIPAIAGIEKLDIRHHYVSPEVVEELQGLGIQVDAERQDAEEQDDEDYRFIAHTE